MEGRSLEPPSIANLTKECTASPRRVHPFPKRFLNKIGSHIGSHFGTGPQIGEDLSQQIASEPVDDEDDETQRRHGGGRLVGTHVSSELQALVHGKLWRTTSGEKVSMYTVDHII